MEDNNKLKIEENETYQEANNDLNITFNHRLSVNGSSHDETKSETSEVEYRYERRIAEPTPSSINFFQTDKFNKVIIPYNFEKKKYTIKSKDIEFYESKEYLKSKLEEYNKNPNFDIDRTYSPKSCCERIKIFFPIIFIMIILLYAGFIFTLLSGFNPIVIYSLYSYIKKAYNSLNMFKFILLEKFKMNRIRGIISNENKSKICKSIKITWKIGRSGYWIEVQKNID